METSSQKVPYLGDDFSLKKINQGQKTAIFRCENESSHQVRALKCIAHKKDAHVSECEQLKYEFQITSKLQHPNIIKPVNYYHLQETDTSFCVILQEYLQQDLFQYCHSTFPTVDLQKIKLWLQQLSNALSYMHCEQKLAHFDLKPENLMLDQKQNIKIIDFGLASYFDKITNSSFYKSWRRRSRLYMAPEILKWAKRIDEDFVTPIVKNLHIDWGKVDVFALGVTLFSVIFFQSPFDNSEASTEKGVYKYLCEDDYEKFWSSDKQVAQLSARYRKQIDNFGELQDLLWNMMSHDPEKRFDIKQVQKHEFLKDNNNKKVESKQVDK